MKLLLDAHTLVWYTAGSSLLPRSAVDRIGAQPDECAVSIATLWEIGIKHSIGKLQLGMSLSDFMNAAIEDNGFALLPILPTHIAASSGLPFHHRDPFDRMIIAQALSENLQVISRDQAFDAYGVKRIW